MKRTDHRALTDGLLKKKIGNMHFDWIAPIKPCIEKTKNLFISVRLEMFDSQ